MGRKTLAQAMADQEPPPCEKYDCKFEYYCKDNAVCCQAFQYYVETEKSVHPSTYNIGQDDQHEWDRYYPTEETYAQVFLNKRKKR